MLKLLIALTCLGFAAANYAATAPQDQAPYLTPGRLVA